MTNEGNCVPSCDENRIAQYRMMLYNLQRKPRANTTNLESIDQCWSEIHCIALLPWIVVLRMQMQSLMFFFWGGDFHASVLSFLEPATSACSWHVKTHSSSKLIGTTSETIRNQAEPHRADNWFMIFQDGSCSENQLCQLFSALLCSISRTYQENVVTCRDMCKAVSNPNMTHAQPDSPGLHGLPTIAKETTEGLTLWTHGRNMKELIVLNEFQWYTIGWYWLPDLLAPFGCECPAP